MQPAGAKAHPVLEELEKILASPGFARSERLQGFLRFVVDQKLQGKASELKESVIGTEVFGRKPDYDPHSDPVVRLEAAKLRARLGEYYAGPGAVDPVRIEIPKGAYVPQWQSIRGRRWGLRRSVVTSAAVLGLAIAGVSAWRWTRTVPKPTLAVLPFLNLSHDRENEYFSDGLADEITELLARADGLEVIARTSSFALKGARLDAREIGTRLNATVLLEGSVQKSSDRVKIIVQLIRAPDGKHLWSNSYEREMRDIFGTQREIAGAIASALRLKLGGTQRHYTESLEALELYFRGRYALDRRQSGVALQYFEQAAASDANYALAYAGAAQALLQLAHADTQPRAKTAAERALQLDPALSEAHAALGEIEVQRYIWPEAERALRRAIELNPSNAVAHSQLGYYLLAPLGRFEEAVSEVRRAQGLDPLSYRTNIFAAYTLLMAGQYREAEQVVRKTIALDPNGLDVDGNLARSLSFQGRHGDAMAVVQEANRRAPERGMNWQLACVAVRAGRRDEAALTLEQNLSPARGDTVPNRRLFMLYACLGDKERALEYAEKMYAERDPYLPSFLAYPEVVWLRSEPRIGALRQRIGLPPA
jgi:serine/threonine-protein kinase